MGGGFNCMELPEPDSGDPLSIIAEVKTEVQDDGHD